MRKFWLVGLVLIQLGTTAHASELLRFFVSVDGPVELHVLEMDHQGTPVALIRLLGTKHVDAGRVFMFSNRDNKRFNALHHASPMVLIDYGERSLVAGTLKKVWTLAGVGTDLKVEERAPPANLTAQRMRDDYQAAEGANLLTLDQMIKAAQDLTNQKCATALQLKINPSGFDHPNRPPSFKVMGAAMGLAEACADSDYRAALKGFEVLWLEGTSGPDLQFKTKGTTLTITLPADIQNTSQAVKTLVEQKL